MTHKFESRFLGVTVPTNRSVMFGSLSGSKLGIWVAHGEGKFSLPYDEGQIQRRAEILIRRISFQPQRLRLFHSRIGKCRRTSSGHDAPLGTCHLPLAERLLSADRVNSDQITPWIEAFVNARKWVEANKKMNFLFIKCNKRGL